MKQFTRRVIEVVILIPVYLYRWFISPLTGASCRHTPTCSQYAIDAIRNTGPLRGFLLATDRFFRCRPGGTFGFDPAPKIWVKRYRNVLIFGSVAHKSNRLKEHE